MLNKRSQGSEKPEHLNDEEPHSLQLEKEKAIKMVLEYLLHSRVFSRRRQWHPTPVLLLGKIPWMEEPGRL